MQKFQDQNIEWLEFDLLSDIPHLKQASFLRNGGFSQGPFTSLNLSYEVGDEPQHVTHNRKCIQEILARGHSTPLELFWAKQCHGKQVTLLNAQSPKQSLNCDGLITKTPGVCLMICHADCQAAIFYDPIQQAIANVHSGWRGSVLNIYQETIHHMQKAFGSKPQDILVCISPSLGPEDAEFIHYNHELPEEFWRFQVRPTYFDFWAISEYQLQMAGILPHHIEIARLSTYSNPHDYYSYRYARTTGRHATCVVLI